MKLALHRSITFWSGILVMAFIGWAWGDSVANWSKLQTRHQAVSNISGGIVVECGTDPTVCFPWSGRTARPQAMRMPAFKGPHLERGGTRDFFADISEFVSKNPDGPFGEALLDVSAGLGLPQGPLDQAFGTMYYRPEGDWRLFIPHWLLLLIFAIPWAALLLWRARRRKRAGTHPEQTG